MKYNCYFFYFAGFGGNVVRESVKLHAPWFIMDFNELTQSLWLCATSAKCTYSLSIITCTRHAKTIHYRASHASRVQIVRWFSAITSHWWSLFRKTDVSFFYCFFFGRLIFYKKERKRSYIVSAAVCFVGHDFVSFISVHNNKCNNAACNILLKQSKPERFQMFTFWCFCTIGIMFSLIARSIPLHKLCLNFNFLFFSNNLSSSKKKYLKIKEHFLCTDITLICNFSYITSSYKQTFFVALQQPFSSHYNYSNFWKK